MRLLTVIAAVLGVCASKPLSDYVRSFTAGDGQFVLTQDKSYERGVLETDWSLEYVRPYRGATVTTKTGGSTGHKYLPFASSEEMLYHLYQQGTKGSPHSVRVKALSDVLNTGVLDMSDAYLLHHLNGKAHPKLTDGQYYVDNSGEIYFQSKKRSLQNRQSGTGVLTVKK